MEIFSSKIKLLRCIISSSHNEFSLVPPGVGETAGLLSLDLSFNRLPSSSIRGLPAGLLELDLSGNPLSEAGLEMALPGVPRGLLVLRARGCGLVRVPGTVSVLARLRVLDVSGNALRWLPTELAGLAGLEELRLDGCGLEMVPPEVCALPALVTLSLADNEIREVPQLLARSSPRLRALNLSGNRLTALPSGFGAMAQLESLDLSGNANMGPLPVEEMARLRRLKRLHMARCTLWALPKALFHLQSLTDLDLSQGHLDGVGDLLSVLPALVHLNLSRNVLRAAPAHISTLAHLETADLSFNALAGPMPVELARCRSLRRLVVSSNQISELFPKPFGKALREVVAENCQLLAWGDAVDSVAGLIELIDVRGNPSLKPTPQSLAGLEANGKLRRS
jgi:Leucine-rich repeat (LRR) protein